MKLSKINGFDNYLINEIGEIFSCYVKGKSYAGANFRKMRTSIGTSGYETIHLYRDKKRHTLAVHRLMAEVFLGEAKECVNHKDGNKLNNNADNLEWVSYSENNKHAFKTGLSKGPPIKRKITDEQILTIRTFNSIAMDKVFADMYGVDKSSINRIRNNKNYAF